MITIPLLALIGQFVLIVIVFLGFYGRLMSKITSLSSRIEASDKANETLRSDFTAHGIYIKEEFLKIGGTDEKIISKLELIKDGMHDIKLDVVEIKSEMKFKNGNKT